MKSIDLFINNFFYHFRTIQGTEYMYLISRIFDVTVYTVLVTVLIGIFIYYVRGKRYSILFLEVMLLGAVISVILKSYFQVPRPPMPVYSVFGSSFPSYHAVIVTIFFSMLIFIFDDYLTGFFRKMFNALCIFGIFIVSFSRLYLGVHWFSDVIAGILFGFIIFYLSIEYFKKLKL